MNQKKKGLILIWSVKAVPSLFSVKLLYFPVLIYYLCNSNVNFCFCHKEDFDSEVVNVKAVQFSKLVASWRSVPSRSADYLDSYLLTSFFYKDYSCTRTSDFLLIKQQDGKCPDDPVSYPQR